MEKRNFSDITLSQYKNGIFIPLKLIEYLDYINALAEECSRHSCSNETFDEYFKWVNNLKILVEGYNLMKIDMLSFVKKDILLNNTECYTDLEIYTYDIIKNGSI